MATDAGVCCPVCSEPYDAAPEECFRCETPLGTWWRFEEAVGRSRPREPGPRRHVAIGVLVGAIVATVALRFLSGTAHAPDESVAPVLTVPASVPSTAPAVPAARAVDASPRVVSYRVQPGDSLWRIAAALTGDGGNWTTLWPATDAAKPLAVGTVLEVPIR